MTVLLSITYITTYGARTLSVPVEKDSKAPAAETENDWVVVAAGLAAY